MAEKSSSSVAIVAIIAIVILIIGIFYFLSGRNMPGTNVAPTVNVTAPPATQGTAATGGGGAGTTAPANQ